MKYSNKNMFVGKGGSYDPRYAQSVFPLSEEERQEPQSEEQMNFTRSQDINKIPHQTKFQSVEDKLNKFPHQTKFQSVEDRLNFARSPRKFSKLPQMVRSKDITNAEELAEALMKSDTGLFSLCPMGYATLKRVTFAPFVGYKVCKIRMPQKAQLK